MQNKTDRVELVVVGSVGIDAIATPAASRSSVLGGAATYASAAASFFAKTGLVGVVGNDFPAYERSRIERFGVDLSGLQTADGATFRWSGEYEDDFINRRTLDTQLGVFADFEPEIPPDYREAPFLLLGNISPELQLHVLDQMPRVGFVAIDTMDLWIKIARDALCAAIARVDMLMLNDGEARMLSGRHNLRDCARALLDMGPRHVVIKKGEHGAMLFSGEEIAILPAYPVRELVDPTGAGDMFAGACMGHLADAGNVDRASLVDGLWHGGVVASFGVEAFGLDALDKLTRAAVEARAAELREMTPRDCAS